MSLSAGIALPARVQNEGEALLEASRNLSTIPTRPVVVIPKASSDDDPKAAPTADYPYQIRACELLAGHNNLLVASPTGSGKTRVIAEAVRRSTQENQLIIIAEPLIALVEQIYETFEELFDSTETTIEMRTGPSSRGCSPDALVSICTYEVVAAMCSSNGGLPQGVGRVVIDEFHFIASDRGPVLQEVLDGCREAGARVLALSGTLPNELEVAGFLSAVNGLPTYIAGATTRIVPLEFYYYDLNNAFAPFCAIDATRSLAAGSPPAEPDAAALGGMKGRQDVLRLLERLVQWDCMPSLIVAFSCRTLDRWAMIAATRFSFLNRSQRSIVTREFASLLLLISEEDKPLFLHLLPLAQKGIGLHHAKLPVQYLHYVCKMAELRLLPLVFSTSTLSAGINLPVRTVCLTTASLPKRDGPDLLQQLADPLLVHQLAGRAGRPGYESTAYFVVLGRGSLGCAAAQALLRRPLPSVRPPEGYSSGDCLRAAIAGRLPPLDRLVFSGSAAAQAIRRSQASSKILALLQPPSRRESVFSAAKQLFTIMRGPTPLMMLSAAAPVRNQTLFLHRDGERGAFSVSTSVSATLLAVKKGGAVATGGNNVHVSVFSEALVQRSAKIAFLEAWEHGDASFRALVTVAFNAISDKAEVEGLTDMTNFRTVCSSLSASAFLDAFGAPTQRGLAAAKIRTCSQPEKALDVVLEFGGSLNADAFVLLASVLLGVAGGADETALLPSQLAHMEGSFQQLAISGPRYNTAALAWSTGETLLTIAQNTGVEAGEACRHFVRMADVLAELELALRAMQAEVPAALTEASVRIVRGLPFARKATQRAVCYP
jgi:hypothetical protein